MRLILHIGTQKTGTSALQFFLNRNRIALKKDGIRYPALSEFSSIIFSGVSYHNCVSAAIGGYRSSFVPVSKEDLVSLRNMISSSDQPVLLSGEDFSRMLDTDGLKRFTSGLDVSVIVYLREQAAWVQSMYNQRNKVLFDRADDRVLSEDILSPHDLFRFLQQERYQPILKYDELLDRWSQIGTVVPRIFDKHEFVGGNLMADFMANIGITDLSHYEMPPRVNENLANEWIHLVKEVASSEGVDAARRLMTSLSKRYREGKIDLSGATDVLPDKIKAKLASDYAGRNSAVAKKYFGRPMLFA